MIEFFFKDGILSFIISIKIKITPFKYKIMISTFNLVKI